ncbi:MAG: hypothetical protein D6754_00785 [Alphaproteobacteria bacterium]|nr:MAG: hypothetical protein D6754_00785 [Alphaproteobacteria bacterium]
MMTGRKRQHTHSPKDVAEFLARLSPVDARAVETYRALALGGILGLGAMVADRPDRDRLEQIQHALRDIDAALTGALHDLLTTD